MTRRKPPPRVYFPMEPTAHGICELPPQASHHLVHVLRLVPGDALVLFDGAGHEYDATIERMVKGRATVRLGHARALDRESPLRVTLAQGVSSGERMDYTIQKAVELGVHAIQPLMTERSIVRLDTVRAAKRLEHWRGIAIGACEQCGRNQVPQVLPLSSLTDWLASLTGASLRITLSPGAQATLAEVVSSSEAAIILLVGPEGGLAPREEHDALASGFTAVRLGPRVLRTETAAVAALAALQTLHGDF